MSIRRQEIPYSANTTANGYKEWPLPAGELPGVGYIVKPNGSDYDNCFAISNPNVPAGYDFFSPITKWQIMVTTESGQMVMMEYDEILGWIISGGIIPPDVIVFARASVYSIRVGETYYVPDRVNFLHNGFTNDGELINDGAVVEVS